MRAARGTTQTGGIEVRHGTDHDLDVIIELRLALLREYGDHPIYGQLRRDAAQRARPFYAAQLRAPDQTILLAEMRGAVVGITRCVDVLASPVLMPTRYCYLSSVYVRPEARRSGVLRALMQSAEHWARGRKLTEMRLHNSSSSADAMATWDAMGFQVVEQVRRRRLR